MYGKLKYLCYAILGFIALGIVGCANTAHLTFYSQPPGAVVYDDLNRVVGTTPCRYNLGLIPPFAYDVDVWDPGKSFTACFIGYEPSTLHPKLGMTEVRKQRDTGKIWNWSFMFNLEPIYPKKDSSFMPHYQAESTIKRSEERTPSQGIYIGQYPGPLRGHWISELFSYGKYILLEDNSLWEIDSLDIINTVLWLPVSNIVIIANHYQGYVFYDLVNTDEGEKASARYLGIVQLQTNIEGEFEGWDGDTVFIFANGNVLKQISYSYTYHYAYRPRALVYISGNQYYLMVDGVQETIMVAVIK